MTVLASKDQPKVSPCDLEINTTKVSYTYDTLLQISESHPDSIIYEIIGGDSAEHLHQWKNYKKMKELCKFAYFKRKGYSSTSQDIISIEAPLFHVSSTLIREKITNNEPLGQYLTPEVEEYIKENKLYR
jgi:nicotinate-nucleotide adenylyltransferase